MKTENTPANKARFFALYINQKVLNDGQGEYLYYLTGSLLHDSVSSDYLSLRSISSLTDEEIMLIVHYQGYINAEVSADLHFDLNGPEFSLCIESTKHDCYDTANSRTVDYLRSIGMLIPWMDLSVEEIQAYGWAKDESSQRQLQ
jgi:hypothetical protein